MNEVTDVVAAAQAGDEIAFSALFERHRRELQLHCYRMLGSFEDSEDLLQETFLRAWRRRETYQGRSTFRAWLYKIATNACLDAIQRRPRTIPGGTEFEVPWLQPYPDQLLEDAEAEPDAAVVARETIELAFLVAIQYLPPKTRAVLILRDVLDWSAKDSAALLDTTVASVNSALQRARAALKEHLPERRTDWAADPSEQERALAARYFEACERGDVEAVVAMMHEDARFAMPPQPEAWTGREKIAAIWIEGGFGTAEFGEIRCLLTAANRQPAVANYVRQRDEPHFRALAVDVLRIEAGTITEIVAFGSAVFPALGLPPVLKT